MLFTLRAGTELRRDDVCHHIRSTIDVFVQLNRVAGRRHVAEVVLQRPGS